MSKKYHLQETLSPIDKKGRDLINENWTRIMAYFDDMQYQIKVLVDDQEIDELLARIAQALSNAELSVRNYIKQVDTTVQQAIAANDNATKSAINNVNAALQDLNTAITKATTATTAANSAAQNANDKAALIAQAIKDVQNAIVIVNQAITDVNVAKELAINAATNADSKAALAGEKATLAHNATQAAYTATQNADNKAGLANVAANAANTATTNANNAATNANEKATLAQTRIDELNGLDADINTAIANAETATDATNVAITNADSKATLAHNATQAAHTATQNADTATQNANNAATDARKAITDAQTATANATTATQQAQDATTAAQTATGNANQAIVDIQDFVDELDFVGEYSASVTYAKNNLVRYNRSTYASLQTVKGSTPSDNGITWRLVAPGGVDGTGAVSTVNGILPDASGNVVIDIGGDVQTVNSKSPDEDGNVALTKADIDLANVDNTSDADKPVSTATQTELNKKAKAEDLVNLSQTVTKNKNEVTEHLANYLPHGDDLTLEASNSDVNNVYTIADFKRADTSLYLNSVLSNPDSSGNYQKATWKFYDVDGTTLKLTVVWAVTYDENGIKNSHKIISKVVAE